MYKRLGVSLIMSFMFSDADLQWDVLDKEFSANFIRVYLKDSWDDSGVSEDSKLTVFMDKRSNTGFELTEVLIETNQGMVLPLDMEVVNSMPKETFEN